MKYKITIKNNGAEVNIGQVFDKEQQKLILTKKSNKELDLYMENEEGVVFDFSQQTERGTAYGPFFNERLKVSFQEQSENMSLSKPQKISYDSLTETNSYFELECPYVEPEKGELFFAGYQVEKNMEVSFEIETDTFKPENLIFGFTNFEDVFNKELYVIKKYFYFTDSTLQEMATHYDNTVEEMKMDLNTLVNDEEYKVFFDKSEITDIDIEPGTVNNQIKCLVLKG